jgi:hypothetical protein
MWSIRRDVKTPLLVAVVKDLTIADPGSAPYQRTAIPVGPYILAAEKSIALIEFDPDDLRLWK